MKLNNTKYIWDKLLHDVYSFFFILINLTFSRPRCIFVFKYNFCKVLWSNHTRTHSTTKEIPFKMVYDIEVVLLVNIGMPTCGMNILMKKVRHA